MPETPQPSQKHPLASDSLLVSVDGRKRRPIKVSPLCTIKCAASLTPSWTVPLLMTAANDGAAERALAVTSIVSAVLTTKARRARGRALCPPSARTRHGAPRTPGGARPGCRGAAGFGGRGHQCLE